MKHKDGTELLAALFTSKVSLFLVVSNTISTLNSSNTQPFNFLWFGKATFLAFSYFIYIVVVLFENRR